VPFLVRSPAIAPCDHEAPERVVTASVEVSDAPPVTPALARAETAPGFRLPFQGIPPRPPSESVT
jgi:hypothetical protein